VRADHPFLLHPHLLHRSSTIGDDMTARRSTARHRAAPVGALRRLWIGTAVLTGAALAGALATGGTYALLSSSAPAPAGTVRSGTAYLGVESPPVVRLQGLVPGGSTTSATTMRNGGQVPLAITVAATDVTAAFDDGPGSTGTGASLDELRLRVTPVAATADCRAGLSGTTQYLKAWATPTTVGGPLAQGVARTFCLEFLLDEDAPSFVQGGVDGFTLRVTGTQVRP